MELRGMPHTRCMPVSLFECLNTFTSGISSPAKFCKNIDLKWMKFITFVVYSNLLRGFSFVKYKLLYGAPAPSYMPRNNDLHCKSNDNYFDQQISIIWSVSQQSNCLADNFNLFALISTPKSCHVLVYSWRCEETLVMKLFAQCTSAVRCHTLI